MAKSSSSRPALMRCMCSGAGEGLCPRVSRGHTIPAQICERRAESVWAVPGQSGSLSASFPAPCHSVSGRTHFPWAGRLMRPAKVLPELGIATEEGWAHQPAPAFNGHGQANPVHRPGMRTTGGGPGTGPGDLSGWRNSEMQLRRGPSGSRVSDDAVGVVFRPTTFASGSVPLPPCFRLLPFDLDDLRRA